MEQTPRPKRKYNSTRRQEQAQETRQRILQAALRLFSTYGYAGATMEAIASEAGVSPLTIFSIFGNKRSVLSALVDVSVGGDDRGIPILERPEPRAVLQESDPVKQIHRFASSMTDILERVSPVFQIMRMAAKTEPEINTLLHTVLSRRLGNLTVFAQRVAENAPLRNGLDVKRAGEMVWAIASPELYSLFTADRGWTKEQFATWLGDTLTRLLLEE